MNRTVLFWATACCSLAIIYLATQQQHRGTHQFRPLSLTTKDIDRIELTGKQPITLLYKQARWHLQLPNSQASKQVLASSKAVNTLLRTLQQLQHDYLVSQHPNKHNQYGVGQQPQQGTIRLLKSNQQLWQLVVGNVANGFGRMHVRLNNTPHIFVVKGAWDNVGLHATNHNRWRNKNVWENLRPAAIQQLSVNNQQQQALWTLRLDAQQNSWQVAQPQQLPPGYQLSNNKVKQLLQSLTQLQAQDFIDTPQAQQQARQQLTQPTATQINITLESGKRYTLKLAPLPPSRSPKNSNPPLPTIAAQLQNGKDNSLYLLTPQQLHSVSPKLAALRDWSLWHLDPNQIQQLSIQKPHQEAIVFAKQNQQWSCTKPDQLPAPHYKTFELDPKRLQNQLQRLCHLQAQGPAPKQQQQQLYTQLLQSGTRIELHDKKGTRHAIRILQAPTPQSTPPSIYYATKEQDSDTLVYQLQGHPDDLYAPAGLATLAKTTRE
ncbi:MAG: DUF4340 domain-containing protein [Myxococcota bacterium]